MEGTLTGKTWHRVTPAETRSRWSLARTTIALVRQLKMAMDPQCLLKHD